MGADELRFLARDAWKGFLSHGQGDETLLMYGKLRWRLNVILCFTCRFDCII